MRGREFCNVRNTSWMNPELFQARRRSAPNQPHRNRYWKERMETIPEQRAITVFVCANCARPGKAPSSAGRVPPVVPDFNWPSPFQQVVVPCTGRLQPEHVLKAFESGSSVVSVVACQDDNCHYVEGSRRCTRRIDFIRSLLNEMGLGEERLLLFQGIL